MWRSCPYISKQIWLRFLELCNHEEADTPLLVHVLNACSFGHRRILIKTNDADVVVLSVSVAENPPADGIWISYGTGKHLRHLAAHEIAKKTEQQISKGLIVVPWHYWLWWHCFHFGGKGKKTAWDVWNVYPALTNVLCRLMLYGSNRKVCCPALWSSKCYSGSKSRKERSFLKESWEPSKHPTNTSSTRATHSACRFPRSIHLEPSASNAIIAICIGMEKRLDIMETQVDDS